MPDTLTARQRQTLDTVERSPANADKEDVEVLATLARQTSGDTQTAAAQTLSIVATEQPELVTDTIGSVLLSLQNSDVNVRTFTLDTIGTLAQHSPARIAETTAITNVVQALNDRNEWIRANAAEVLGAIGTESPEVLANTGVVRTLVHGIGSEEFPDARAQMARTLGRIAQTAPRLIDEQDAAELERHIGDDEIEESLQFAVEAMAEARASTSAVEPGSQGATTSTFCPECGREITTEPLPNFCRNCGQELS
ncbi:HEAT repeat domain-containing protein [Halobellus inordinatus]|uniref:HEAT repeat domain-containing protein n=1 Tax=Halobellus inordinatus TaxID=1126236 RepID=UPI00210D2B8C|nr:HEAT repeat domain-containing protein [Halobellus inordinatus]